MSLVEKDWYMRQLRICIDMAASLVLGKDFSPYEPQDADHPTTADELHQQLMELLDEGNANDAEELLFEAADPEDMDIYEVGLDFYYHLNEMDEPELTRQDFSREEIREGLTDFSEEYGCEGLFDQLQLSWSEEDEE